MSARDAACIDRACFDDCQRAVCSGWHDAHAEAPTNGNGASGAAECWRCARFAVAIASRATDTTRATATDARPDIVSQRGVQKVIRAAICSDWPSTVTLL